LASQFIDVPRHLYATIGIFVPGGIYKHSPDFSNTSFHVTIAKWDVKFSKIVLSSAGDLVAVTDSMTYFRRAKITGRSPLPEHLEHMKT
jgi:hypothetical protein